MIALVDCNNFFASCERLFRPDLKNAPVVVLSSNDGCVVARSQEVRELGIPMGAPYFKVRDVLEQHNVTCFSSNFALYSDISQRILSTLAKYAPELEVYSIDEAFLDLKSLKIKDFYSWGDTIRSVIAKTIGMPVSVGIAPTKTLAKIASGYAKHHEQICVLDPENDPGGLREVLRLTSVGDVWGVGRKLVSRFESVGIRNARQLAGASEEWLHTQFGINGTRMYHELRGQSTYLVEPDKAPQKSLIVSRSFGHTVKNIHELETAVASFASKAAFRLRTHEQTAAVFGLYLKFRTPDGSIQSQSVATSLTSASNDTSELVAHALSLLRNVYDPEDGYKKAGVFAHHLASSNLCQTSLLSQKSVAEIANRKEFMNAIDTINKRYGLETIHVASIDKQATQWHVLKQRMSPAYTTAWSELPLLHQYTGV